jgi:predicted PurR-regulated permease PerM
MIYLVGLVGILTGVCFTMAFLEWFDQWRGK